MIPEKVKNVFLMILGTVDLVISAEMYIIRGFVQEKIVTKNQVLGGSIHPPHTLVHIGLSIFVSPSIIFSK